jgi:hypothetical protein
MGESVAYRFSGHEGFPLRSGWLPKGVLAAAVDPGIFRREDALVELGVGKNMVAAIRHWCVATGVLETTDQGVLVTELGRTLFLDPGFDKYLEDPGTLWLLHWMLVRQPAPASTWHLAFTQWNAPRFGRRHLEERIAEVLAAHPRVTRATPASVQRDVEVFFRTYVGARGGKGVAPEESLDSPLTSLGLLAEVDRETYAFRRGPQVALPEEIFTFAMLDFWAHGAGSGGSAVAFERIAFGAGSPGAAFKLDELSLMDRLSALDPADGLVFNETAGTRVVMRTDDRVDVTERARRTLERYYAPSVVGIGAGQ